VVDLTLSAALQMGRKQLEAAGIAGAGLDARLLLLEATGLTHAELIMRDTEKLSSDSLQKFQTMLQRRGAHEPVSRILGRREFFGRPFKVTPDVLDPRADSEALIELCLRHKKSDAKILDLGTGSGILLLTLLAEWPDATGTASDISLKALDVAQQNAEALGLVDRCQFAQSNWYEAVANTFDFIVSNPPYIIHGDIAGLSPDVRDHDPHLALSGGTDGLDAYRAIANGAAKNLSENGLIAIEIGAGQAPDITAIFAQNQFQKIDQQSDLGGHLRALMFKRF
jgi:release factor glutamine methyltransferase